MQPYQEKFIQLALQYQALRFGTFTLKSGRISPYFFNSGMFVDGAALAELGNFYADAIQEQVSTDFDVIFGPAYKGIQIASCSSIALKQKYNQNYPVSYNRKEAKYHGECGVIVGADLTGKRVLITDDVITAGTAIREAAALIAGQHGTLVGVVSSLDRQEIGQHSRASANQEISQEFGIPVIAIINRDNLIEYVASIPGNRQQDLLQLEKYKEQYGAMLS
jgi:orotate phosphoribosyltransferase